MHTVISDIVVRRMMHGCNTLNRKATKEYSYIEKLEWFSQQKSNKVEEHSFRNDQLCMLVLACCIITDILQNLKNLLSYKHEQICHSRWITIANGYMRMLIFNSKTSFRR